MSRKHPTSIWRIEALQTPKKSYYRVRKCIKKNKKWIPTTTIYGPTKTKKGLDYPSAILYAAKKNRKEGWTKRPANCPFIMFIEVKPTDNIE